MTQIKQHTLQSGERILLVELPSDAKYLEMADYDHFENPNEIEYISQGKYCTQSLPQGNWQLIGISDEITEEQAKHLIEPPKVGETVYDGWHLYRFNRLMQSLGCEGRYAVLREVK